MKLKQYALTFAIAILLPLLFHYAALMMYPKPSWASYRAYQYQELKQHSKSEQKVLLKKQHVLDATYSKASNKHERKRFYIIVSGGILIIIFGALLGFEILSAGLIFGGVLSVLSGFLGSWGVITITMKFFALLLTLVAVLLAAFKAIRSDKKK